MSGERVLVVEDDAGSAAVVSMVCKDEGCEATIVASVAEALRVLPEISPSTLILDLSLPDGDGVEVLHEVGTHHPQTRVILVSGFDQRVLGTARQLAEAIGLEVIADLSKPVPLDLLRGALAGALARERVVTAQDLADAIAADELTVAYQPKINLKAPGFAAAPAVEALVRWRHPHYGNVPPGRMIALASESGQMHALTWAVIRTVFRQMRIWREAGANPAVSINLGAEVLDDRRLPDEVSALADEHGIDPEKLSFEITESSATAHSALVLEIATRFRLRGISLSIDDFGTGWSSLRQLYVLPFNELKIDISFVAEMRRREDARMLVKATIDLAHNLGMTVCAEGVEDFETLSLLNEMGCDAAQGYFISRPVSPRRLRTLAYGWQNPFAA